MSSAIAEVGKLGQIWRMFQKASFSTVIDTCAQISLCCENGYYRQISSLEAMLCCIKHNEEFLKRVDELFAVVYVELTVLILLVLYR